MTLQTAAVIDVYFLSVVFTGLAFYNRYLSRRDRKLKAAVGPDGVAVMVSAAQDLRMEEEREKQRRAEYEEASAELRKAAGKWYRPNAGLPANWDQMTSAEREQAYRRAMDDSQARARAHRKRREEGAA